MLNWPLRSVLVAAGSIFALQAGQVHAGAKTVLELFTSQGCSSCPPADSLFRQYVGREDVIALSFHVDYWDRLGWKDTLGAPENTDRQRQYARSRGDAEVYTPQMVINGRVHANGSSASSIESGIASTSAALQSQHVAIHLNIKQAILAVEIGDAPASLGNHQGTLYLAMVQRSTTVTIARGENAGREVTYLNGVRSMRKIGTWNGTASRVDIPKRDLVGIGASMAVVMLQQDSFGPVLGADTIELRSQVF